MNHQTTEMTTMPPTKTIDQFILDAVGFSLMGKNRKMLVKIVWTMATYTLSLACRLMRNEM